MRYTPKGNIGRTGIRYQYSRQPRLTPMSRVTGGSSVGGQAGGTLGLLAAFLFIPALFVLAPLLAIGFLFFF